MNEYEVSAPHRRLYSGCRWVGALGEVGGSEGGCGYRKTHLPANFVQLWCEITFIVAENAQGKYQSVHQCRSFRCLLNRRFNCGRLCSSWKPTWNTIENLATARQIHGNSIRCGCFKLYLRQGGFCKPWDNGPLCWRHRGWFSPFKWGHQIPAFSPRSDWGQTFFLEAFLNTSSAPNAAQGWPIQLQKYWNGWTASQRIFLSVGWSVGRPAVTGSAKLSAELLRCVRDLTTRPQD